MRYERSPLSGNAIAKSQMKATIALAVVVVKCSVSSSTIEVNPSWDLCIAYIDWKLPQVVRSAPSAAEGVCR